MSSSPSSVIRFALLLVAFSTTATFAASAPTEPVAVTGQAAYPLKTCLVSGARLGSMGKPFAHVSRQAGQPDRTVLFCCRMCTGKFKKDPAKFLAKLDAAETAAKVAR